MYGPLKPLIACSTSLSHSYLYYSSKNCYTVQQVGLAYGPIRACSYSLVHGPGSGSAALAAESLLKELSLTPGSADAMRGKSMFAAYIAASVDWALMIYVIFMNKQRNPEAYFSQIRGFAADIGIRM